MDAIDSHPDEACKVEPREEEIDRLVSFDDLDVDGYTLTRHVIDLFFQSDLEFMSIIVHLETRGVFSKWVHRL